MDIGSLTGRIELDDALSGALRGISSQVLGFATRFAADMGPVGAVLGIATAGVLAFGAAAVTAISSMASKGADINDITQTFEDFSGGTKNAAENLKALQVGTLDTVNKLDLMKAASKLLAADVNLTAKQFGTLGSAAFVLQNQGLGPTKQVLDLLSQSLLTGRTRALEMKIGKIDLAKAERDYAASLGVEKLDQMQKVEAHRLGILDKLNEKVVKAGALHRDFGEQLEFAKAKFDNFLIDLNSAIASSPVLAAGMDAVSSAIEAAFGSGNTGLIKTTVGVVESLTIGVVNLGLAAIEVARVMHTGWSVIKTVVLGTETAIVGTTAAILTATQKVAEFNASLPFASAETKLIAASAKVAAADFWNMAKGLDAQTKEAAKGIIGMSEMDKTFDKLGGTLFTVRDAMKAAQTAQTAVTEGTDKRTKKTREQITADEAAAAAALKHAQAIQGLRDQLSGAGAVKSAMDMVVAVKGLTRAQLDASQSTTNVNKVMGVALDVLNAAGKGSTAAAEDIRKVYRATIELTGTLPLIVRWREGLAHSADDLIPMLKISEQVWPKTIANLERYTPIVGEATAKTVTFQDQIHSLSGAFVQMAQVAGDSFGGVVKDIANVIVSLDMALTSAKQFNAEKASKTEKGIALLGGVSAVGQATGQGSTASRILGGAASGAAIGSVFGPVGAVIGGIGGALTGLFRGISGLTEYQKRTRAAAAETVNLHKSVIDSYGSMERLEIAADLVGIKISEAFKWQDPAAFSKVVDDLNAKTSLLNSAMQEYGFTWEDLGDKARGAALGDLFDTLFAKTDILRTAGIDYHEILARQAEDYSGLVQAAIRTGTEIPAAMQGVLQDLVDMGKLVDENGVAFTDLSKVQWAETLTQGFDKVTEAIDRLADALLNGVGGAMDSISSKVVHVKVAYDDPGYMPTDSGGYPEPQYKAVGGKVLPFPGAPRGSDTVPVWMTPGETVMPAGRSGDEYVAEVSVPLNVDGKKFAEAIVKISKRI